VSDRNTSSLDRVAAGDEHPPAPSSPAPVIRTAEAPPGTLVDVNYPEPTPLATIVRDVAKWSGKCFVMEPSVHAKLQIFAPRRLGIEEGYDLFLASLSVVGLRAVQVGKVVKIVPVTLVVAA
jgi:hypothetical protein